MQSENSQKIQEKVNQTIQQAYDAIAAGNQNTAVLILDQILSQYPDHPDANYQYALIDLALNGRDAALKKFEKAVANKPESELHWVSYIETLMESASLEIVLEALELGQQYALSEKQAQDLAAKFLAKNDPVTEAKVQKPEDKSEEHDNYLKRESDTPAQGKQIASLKDHHSAGTKIPSNNQLMVLIPAYRENFIPELLASVLVQTYQQFTVIVSDDSPDRKVSQLINDPKLAPITSKLDIKVINGPQKGVMSNIVNLVNHCPPSTQYVHVLFDDDFIYPSFYQEHMAAHSQPNVGVSVSQRWKTNEKGFPYDIFDLPEFIKTSNSKTLLVESEALFNSVLLECSNWLGEFSNSVYRFDCIQFYSRSVLADIPYYGLGDIGVILETAIENKVVFIKEHLSGFRQHGLSFSHNQRSKVFKCAVLAWIPLAISAFKLGKIDKVVLEKNIGIVYKTLNEAYKNEPDLQPFLALEAIASSNQAQFETQYLREWDKYIQTEDWVNAKGLAVV